MVFLNGLFVGMADFSYGSKEWCVIEHFITGGNWIFFKSEVENHDYNGSRLDVVCPD